MGELFSDNWMRQLMAKWNGDRTIVEPLQKAQFSSRIAYGYHNEDEPRALLVIDNGMVSYGGRYDGKEVDWDLRASAESWRSWIEGGFGLTKLGPAVATGKLKFVRGNYRQMIRNPALSNPFLHHFELMSQIGIG